MVMRHHPSRRTAVRIPPIPRASPWDGESKSYPPVPAAASGRLVGSPWRVQLQVLVRRPQSRRDRKSTRLNSSHGYISYAVFCLKKKKKMQNIGGEKEKQLKQRTT